MSALPAAGDEVRRRVVTNTLVQFIAPAVRVGVGVALVAILGRYLGVTGFGEYSLVIAYVVIFTGALPEWGLGRIVVREISRHPEQRASLLASAALLQMLIAAVAYAVLLAVALLSGYPAEVRASVAVLGLTVLIAPIQIVASHFETDLRLARLVAPSVAGTLLQLVLVAVVVALGGPLVAVIAATAAAVAAEHAWIAVVTLRDLRLGRPTTAHWGRFVREAWPLGLTTLVSAGARQAPLVVLSLISIDAVGIFNAADRIPTYLARVPYAFRATMFPFLSRSWADRDRFARLLDGVVAGMLLLTMPAAVLGVGLADGVMTFVYGPAFAAAAAPFAVLMTASVFVALAILLESALVAMGGQRPNLVIPNLVIRIAASAVLLAVLAALARERGPTGGALAVLASVAATTVMSLVLVARGTDRAVGVPALVPAAAAVAAATVAGVVTAPLGVVASAAIAAAACAAALVLLSPPLRSEAVWAASRSYRRMRPSRPVPSSDR